MFWQGPWGKVLAVVLLVVAVVMCFIPGLQAPGAALATSLGVAVAGLMIGGCIAGYQSHVNGKGFWRGFERYINGNWAQSVAITSLIFIVSVGVSAIASAVANVNNKTSSRIVERKASKADFTEEAWNEIQSLPHDAKGNTISNAASGRKIHKGYKAGLPGKEYVMPGGRADFLDETAKVIYELKPNNPASIALGKTQLQRYNNALGGGYKLILVLY